MRQAAILITGANGEIGHGLIRALQGTAEVPIIALDIQEIDQALRPALHESIVGNILDQNLLDSINSRYELTAIYHLAALLSTRAEFSPKIAHQVNVDGTLNLLTLAVDQARSQGRPVKFFFPSSLAVYGIPDLETKLKAGAVKEDDFLFPQTMYGCNKLYCELLGSYHARYYQRLAADAGTFRVDFRSIRFPGLISAVTLPAGGTSDYASEMIHAAAQGIPYDCFIREDGVMPFMTMPDAIRAIGETMAAPVERLSRRVYNITAFSPTAAELRQTILAHFPRAEIGFEVDDRRQDIVDSWPVEVDQSAARRDWGWQPRDDFESAFTGYLVPAIKERYRRR